MPSSKKPPPCEGRGLKDERQTSTPAFARPVPGLREDLDVNRATFGGSGLVDGGDDFLDVLNFRSRLTLADLAVEVPEIHPVGELFFALALQVFPDVCLDLLDDTSRLMKG